MNRIERKIKFMEMRKDVVVNELGSIKEKIDNIKEELEDCVAQYEIDELYYTKSKMIAYPHIEQELKTLKDRQKHLFDELEANKNLLKSRFEELSPILDVIDEILHNLNQDLKQD